MPSSLVPPHGGLLLKPMSPEERAPELNSLSRQMPSWSRNPPQPAVRHRVFFRNGNHAQPEPERLNKRVPQRAIGRVHEHVGTRLNFRGPTIAIVGASASGGNHLAACLSMRVE